MYFFSFPAGVKYLFSFFSGGSGASCQDCSTTTVNSPFPIEKIYEGNSRDECILRSGSPSGDVTGKSSLLTCEANEGEASAETFDFFLLKDGLKKNLKNEHKSKELRVLFGLHKDGVSGMLNYSGLGQVLMLDVFGEGDEGSERKDRVFLEVFHSSQGEEYSEEVNKQILETTKKFIQKRGIR